MFQRVFAGNQTMRIMRDVADFLSALKPDKKYTLELKEHRERRSLDANSFAWVLIGKIADALTAEAQGDNAVSKDEVYLDMLKRYGQGGVVKVRNADAEKFCKAWKYNEKHESLTDENAAYYRFWVGSSHFNKAEMSVLINGIVAECKSMGIDTATPDELERMLMAWDGRIEQ